MMVTGSVKLNSIHCFPPNSVSVYSRPTVCDSHRVCYGLLLHVHITRVLAYIVWKLQPPPLTYVTD